MGTENVYKSLINTGSPGFLTAVKIRLFFNKKQVVKDELDCLTEMHDEQSLATLQLPHRLNVEAIHSLANDVGRHESFTARRGHHLNGATVVAGGRFTSHDNIRGATVRRDGESRLHSFQLHRPNIGR